MPAPFRRACTNCVRAKRRCDLDVPRCYRCKVRALDCQYGHGLSTPTRRNGEPPAGNPPSTLTNSRGEAHPDLLVNAATNDWDDLSLPSFPDMDLDWPDIMGGIDAYQVPDLIIENDSPDTSVLVGEIYQARVVYAVTRLKAWPQLLIDTGSTPFMHRHLFKERLPVVIQDVLACCALYAAKNDRNQPLVFQVVREKANALIDSRNHWRNPLDQLAGLQALVLYQIIRLFDGDIRMRADAERTDPTLKSWTQQLKQRMRDASDETSNSTWQEWIFNESLRRTIIVSFTLQGLYAFLRNGWDNSHRDFHDLSFLVQRALWGAQSEFAWRTTTEARAALPVHFMTWDRDMREVQPSDMEELGVIMLGLTKGIDKCCEWLGVANLERFGLSMNEASIGM